MLEEALSNPKYYPSEAASLMLSFVQDLPAGGAVAEKRFFRLFSLLCDRAFGPILDVKDGYRHQEGGWLSSQVRWGQPPPASYASSQQPQQQFAGTGRNGVAGRGSNYRRRPTSLEDEPVVKLLGTVSPSSSAEIIQISLLEAISKEAEHRPGVLYPLPFFALPQSTQNAWMRVLQRTLGIHAMATANDNDADSTTDNAVRLYGTMLRVRPEEQHQLRLHLEKMVAIVPQDSRQPLWLRSGISPGGRSGTPVRSPRHASPLSPGTPGSAQNQSRVKDSSPNVLLSMLEYYLFVFIRYPLAVPAALSKQPSNSDAYYDQQRKIETFGEKIYYHLFRRYLKFFFPHPKSSQIPTMSSTNYSAANNTNSSATSEAELFLRIVIDLWLESHVVAPTTSKAMGLIQEQLLRIGSSNIPSYNLNMSYDLAHGKYDPPPLQVQKCIRHLIVHTIADPTVCDYVMNKDIITGATRNNNGSCLSQAMNYLQQPFYNYIRTTLRHASIHVERSPFFTAMDTWLMWLEPWNVSNTKTTDFSAKNATQRIFNSVSKATGPKSSSQRVLRIPRPLENSKYNSNWEPYVAANLYLYTVPLAIFLRRARELDFSSKEFSRSMRIVQRVFRIYTPELVKTLNNLTDSRPFTDSNATLSNFVSQHKRNLGAYAPILGGNLALTSCQADVCSLLEEIYMQHMKTVRDQTYFDYIADTIEGLFGHGTISRYEKDLDSLVKRAKVIVGLSHDYEVFPSRNGKRSSTFKTDPINKVTSHPARTNHGYLTDEGRNLIVSGNVKCSPMDVTYVGDRMFSRVNSHEIGFLVVIMIRISNWLNSILGLHSPYEEKYQGGKFTFRINLRFFADYRNLLFVFCVYWLLKLIF